MLHRASERVSCTWMHAAAAGFYRGRCYVFARAETNSYRAWSTRPVRGDRHRIRKARRVPPKATNPSPKRRRPKVAVRVSWCGIWGTRLFPCRTRAPQIGGYIPCRCIQKSASANPPVKLIRSSATQLRSSLPASIRINLWRVRKFQTPAATTVQRTSERPGAPILHFARGAGFPADTCRLSPAFFSRAEFLCHRHKSGSSKLQPESKSAAGATGRKKITRPRSR